MDFRTILMVLPVMLFSVIAHEYAHGYAALKQGDTTALSLGRLTWNPIKHIHPVLTILLPIALAVMHQPIIGGAKPVPVNPNNYRNFKRGDIIVSLAGVFTNFLIALGCAAMVGLTGLIARGVSGLTTTMAIIQVMMELGVWLNFSLVVFNLIPVPPLDGSHVLKYLLPAKIAVHYQRIGFAGIILLIVLMRGHYIDGLFAPAMFATNFVLRPVEHLILPQTQLWMPT